MDCRECYNDLTAYIDGELADPTMERLKLHLDQCRPCFDEYRELNESKSFVGAHARVIEPVPEIWNNLRSRIAEMPAPNDSSGFFRFLVVNRWVTAVSTLAATVLLAVGLLGYMQYQHSQQELEVYMEDYIQMRDITERLHILRTMESEAREAKIDGVDVNVSENPFAEVIPASFSGNPFRVEER